VANSARLPPPCLERLREAGLKKFSELRCCPELRDGIQFLERRYEGIRQAHRPRLELLILRLEIQIMHRAGKVLGSFQFAFDERLVDNDLGGDVRQFASLPGFPLLAHRLKVSLHSVDTDGDTVDERERLRVLGENRSKLATEAIFEQPTQLVARIPEDTCGSPWRRLRPVRSCLELLGT
jgi:hypothetical protein